MPKNLRSLPYHSIAKPPDERFLTEVFSHVSLNSLTDNESEYHSVEDLEVQGNIEAQISPIPSKGEGPKSKIIVQFLKDIFLSNLL